MLFLLLDQPIPFLTEIKHDKSKKNSYPKDFKLIVLLVVFYFGDVVDKGVIILVTIPVLTLF